MEGLVAFLSYAAFLLAPTAGFTSVMTAALSSELGSVIGDKLWAGAFQNCIGLGCFYICALIGRNPSIIDSLKNWIKTIPKDPFSSFAFVFGGLCSAYYVAVGVIIPAQIGYGVFFVAAVCFEILTSLLLEFSGILWTEKHPVSFQTISGSIIVIGGTIMFQVESLTKDATLNGSNWYYLILAFIAGFLVVVQTAFNRRFGTIVHTPFRSLAFGQTVSTAAQFCAAAVSTTNVLVENIDGKRDFWKFFAGFCTFVTLSSLILLPSFIGYAATYGWFIFGQLTTSLVLDGVGAFHSEKVPTTALRIIGVLVVLLGVLVVQLSKSEKYSDLLPGILRKLTGRKRENRQSLKEKELYDNNDTSSSSSRSSGTSLSRSFIDVPMAVKEPRKSEASSVV